MRPGKASNVVGREALNEWKSTTMKQAALLAAISFSSLALADGPDSVAGSYRLELSPEVKSTAQKLGMPEPYVRILLRNDGTFSYASNANGSVSGASGTFQVSDNQVRLNANGVFPAQKVKTLVGNTDRGGMTIDGLHFVRAGSFDINGTWTVHSNGVEDRSIKMVFNQNGTFQFVCVGASSKGRYELNGDQVTLVWTEVDGEAVAAGSMRKSLYLREDGSFNIDTFRYEKG